MKKILTGSLIALFAFSGLFAQAATVKNSVSSSANSGGNVAKEGQVMQGKAKAQVTVKTTVNGEVMEDIDETDEGKPGEDATTSVEVKTTVGNSAVASQVELKVGGVTRSIKKSSEMGEGTTTLSRETQGTTTIGTKNNESVSGGFGWKTIISSVWKKFKYVFSFSWI